MTKSCLRSWWQGNRLWLTSWKHRYPYPQFPRGKRVLRPEWCPHLLLSLQSLLCCQKLGYRVCNIDFEPCMCSKFGFVFFGWQTVKDLAVPPQETQCIFCTWSAWWTPYDGWYSLFLLTPLVSTYYSLVVADNKAGIFSISEVELVDYSGLPVICFLALSHDGAIWYQLADSLFQLFSQFLLVRLLAPLHALISCYHFCNVTDDSKFDYSPSCAFHRSGEVNCTHCSGNECRFSIRSVLLPSVMSIQECLSLISKMQVESWFPAVLCRRLMCPQLSYPNFLVCFDGTKGLMWVKEKNKKMRYPGYLSEQSTGRGYCCRWWLESYKCPTFWSHWSTFDFVLPLFQY